MYKRQHCSGRLEAGALVLAASRVAVDISLSWNVLVVAGGILSVGKRKRHQQLATGGWRLAHYPRAVISLGVFF